MWLRDALKRSFLARYVMRKLRARRYARLGREAAFAAIYEENAWGSGESLSGPGSELMQTLAIRDKLPELLLRLDVKTVLDASCGDFHWMKEVNLGAVRYVGADIVADVVARNVERYGRPGRAFMRADIVADTLPAADLVLCRDCLMHLSFAEIHGALANLLRTGAAHFLLTTFRGTTRNASIGHGGWWPMNLEIAPFHLPAPMEMWAENPPDEEGRRLGKSMGLWRREMIEGAVGGKALISSTHAKQA